MKNFAAAGLLFGTLILAAMVGSVALAPSDAHAGDVYKSTLASTDGGTFMYGTTATLKEYKLVCERAACYDLGTAATPPAPTCATDLILTDKKTYLNPANLEIPLYELKFRSGGFTRIAALALDAGNPGCKLYDQVVNP